jgi:molybdopterin molybdotransferase
LEVLQLTLFNALNVEQAKLILKQHLTHHKRKFEEVNLFSAYNMVLAEDILSQEDVPGFSRSTVDGFAVKASDTFGATEALPAILTLTGEIKMGQKTCITIEQAKTAKIPTGGMLPEGSDSVVMLEYTQLLDENTVCIERPVAPGDNVVARGEDIKKGSILLKSGHTIRPQDLGALAGIGRSRVKVVKPPVVSVISTGDEIKNPDKDVAPGEVRDINTYAVCGLAAKWGAVPKPNGIVKDDFYLLQHAVKTSLCTSDIVLLSGGSSVGAKDHTVKVIDSLGKPGVLVHGLSVKPGKPTVIGVVDSKPIIGLPGHPVSAMIIFELIVRPLISMFLGRPENFGGTKIFARISRNISSAAGRQDFIRVRLEQRGGQIWAIPVLGKSGLISTMVESHGLAQIPPEKQGFAEGDIVEVELF